MFNNRTNTKLHVSRQEKNGEIFITPDEVFVELEHYGDELCDKVVYVPNTKKTIELASCDAFVQVLKDMIYDLDTCPKALVYSFYDENDNFILIKCTENSIEKTVIPNEDEDRLFLVMKQIDKSDVIVCNPEGSKRDAIMKYITLSHKDYIMCVNKSYMTTKDGIENYEKNRVHFGYNLPVEFFNADTNKYTKRGDMMWITSFETNACRNYISTFWTYEDGLKFGKYQCFDNYEAINVDEKCCIPMGYEGIMGIPVTILPELNVEQFEIISFRKGNDGKDLSINGKDKFTRVLVRFRNI